MIFCEEGVSAVRSSACILSQLGQDLGGVSNKRVAVGMPVARHPPPRSVREELPHTAPASGRNAQAFARIRMQYSRLG